MIQLNKSPEQSKKSANKNLSYYENIFSALQEHANDAQKSIEERTHELEEAFLDIVTFLFTQHSITIGEKIVISLTEDGKLLVSEHSQAAFILTLFEKTPQCLKILQRLAADALLKRGLQYIQNAQTVEDENVGSSRIIYQSSIKGDLSHFYLI